MKHTIPALIILCSLSGCGLGGGRILISDFTDLDRSASIIKIVDTSISSNEILGILKVRGVAENEELIFDRVGPDIRITKKRTDGKMYACGDGYEFWCMDQETGSWRARYTA